MSSMLGVVVRSRVDGATTSLVVVDGVVVSVVVSVVSAGTVVAAAVRSAVVTIGMLLITSRAA